MFVPSLSWKMDPIFWKMKQTKSTVFYYVPMSRSKSVDHRPTNQRRGGAHSVTNDPKHSLGSRGLWAVGFCAAGCETVAQESVVHIEVLGRVLEIEEEEVALKRRADGIDDRKREEITVRPTCGGENAASLDIFGAFVPSLSR